MTLSTETVRLRDQLRETDKNISAVGERGQPAEPLPEAK